MINKLMSAKWLVTILQINDDLCSINQEKCKQDFERFRILHDKEIERLNNCKVRQALKNVI